MKKKSRKQKLIEIYKIQAAYKYDTEAKIAKEFHVSYSDIVKALHYNKFTKIKDARLNKIKAPVARNKNSITNDSNIHKITTKSKNMRHRKINNHKTNLTKKEQEVENKLNKLDINDLNINQINSLFFNKDKMHRRFVKNHIESLYARFQELERTGKTTTTSTNKHGIFHKLFHRK